MPESSLPHDPLWPRANSWFLSAEDTNLSGGEGSTRADVGLLGVPAFQTSLSATGAHATPAAVREALARYSTWAADHNVDVASLTAVDFGDVDQPDGAEGEMRVIGAASDAAQRCGLLIALGGDNSITYPVARGVFEAAGKALPECGLITVDAHHDLRDGASNGSPVRRLIEAGLPGKHVVQLGIGNFSNSPAYAARARELGITVITRDELRREPLAALASRALAIAGAENRPVYVDLDVDVCDRAAVPGCPAAAPGGISADELRQLAMLLARSPHVCGMDITEVDATADAPDGRTVRLAALLVLEAAAGFALRAPQGLA